MSGNGDKWTCVQCGANVESSGSFCPYCGKNRVEPVQAQDPNAPAQVVMAPPVPPQPKKKRSVIIPLVAVIVVAAIFLGIAYQGIIVIEGITKPLETGEGDYTFEWNYQGREFIMKMDITDQQYDYYADMSAIRHFTADYWGNVEYDHVADFITPSDPLIMEIAMNIFDLADQAGFDDYDTLSLALSFVQSIPYEYDIDQFGVSDYWAFPVETLVNYAGDCEDTGYLFASIAEAMGVDSAIIIFDDHIAAGVECEDAWGTFYTKNGVQFYYCETTGEGWEIGVIPDGRGSAIVVDV